MSRFSISSKMDSSPTLPASFYRDAAVFNEVAEKIFLRTWLYATGADVVVQPVVISARLFYWKEF
ncbi:MAG: hypothetical protein AAFZ15_32695 [Bacteroidota bacterium]